MKGFTWDIEVMKSWNCHNYYSTLCSLIDAYHNSFWIIKFGSVDMEKGQREVWSKSPILLVLSFTIVVEGVMMCIIVQIIFIWLSCIINISSTGENRIELSQLVIEITWVEVSFTSPYKGFIRDFALYVRSYEIMELLNFLWYVL